MRQLDRLWRSLVGTFCFVAFGIGGTLLSALVFPLLTIAPGSRCAKHRRARRMIGFFFRLLIRVLQKTRCMQLDATGLDQLAKAHGALVLANHPTYIDVVVLLSLLPEANCVVKGALWRNPFYWGIVRAAGYIDNTSSESLVEACAQALLAGETLVLFPEGTRTVPGQCLSFQRGAAHIAVKSKARAIPVLISCNPPALSKGQRWWLAPSRRFTFRLVVQKPLPADFFATAAEKPAIGARRITDAMKDYFSRELSAYGHA